MSYLVKLSRVIDHIEKNLKREITLGELAEISTLSKFYFHRIFSAATKSPVMEYIRKRRLTQAALELVNTKKSILEIAINYQFSSQEAFTRAFKKNYGINPGEYRRMKPEIELNTKFDINLLKEGGGRVLKPRIVVKDEFMVMGLSVKTSNEENEKNNVIGRVWEEYLLRRPEISWKKKPHMDLGVCEIIEDLEDEFNYICCTEVEAPEPVPEGMVAERVPASKYAVFTHRGPADKLGDTYDYILGRWLPNSDFEINKSGHDFELYDERFTNGEDSEMEIYIPIK